MFKCFRRFITLSSIGLIIVFSTETKAQGYQFRYDVNSNFPKPTGFVTDNEQVLSPLFIQDYEQKLTILAQKTGVEFAIVTIKTIQNYTHFVPYAIDLFNSWCIGTEKSRKGICVLFSSQLGKIRITIGQGLMKKITDEFCNDLINKKMMPFFKNEAYEKGIQVGIDALLSEIGQ